MFTHVDEEDIEKDNEVAKFEKSVNFRHSKNQNVQIRFYERDVKSQLRVDKKKSAKAENRKKVKERKKQEKQDFRNKIELVKNFKRKKAT